MHPTVSYTAIRRSPIPLSSVRWSDVHRARERNEMTTPIPLRSRATYPFQLRDPVSGRYVRARFIATLKDIADCCAAWEIITPARPEPEPQ